MQALNLFLTLLIASVSFGAVAQGMPNAVWTKPSRDAVANAVTTDYMGKSALICRGEFQGTPVLGFLPPGSKGCQVRSADRQMRVAAYEILVFDGSAAPAVRPKPDAIRGVTPQGEVFTETRLPDGSIVRRTRGGTSTILPDGTRPSPMVVYQQAYGGVPPVLPNDLAHRAWFAAQNEKLLETIKQLLAINPTEIAVYQTGEDGATGGDVIQQLVYRIESIRILTGAP